MLKNQLIIDNLFRNPLKYKENEKKPAKLKIRLLISGMSNIAACSLTRKDLFFPTVYNLILDYNQYPGISTILKKQAAFNLIPGRQSKFKITLNLLPYPTFLTMAFPYYNFNNNKDNNFNYNNTTKNFKFGFSKKFYGANFNFYADSSFIISYLLLPLNNKIV
jgi:hypothetical protein